MDWQPIETAPKDGTVIIVRVVQRFENPGKFLNNIRQAYWIDELGEWTIEGMGFNIPPKMTHWCPITDPTN